MTEKSKFASHKLIATRSVTLVYLLHSKVLLCGIQARDEVLQRIYSVRKALYIIVQNQMSPRHISGILFEYPQFTM